MTPLLCCLFTLPMQLYVLSLSLVRVDVGALVSSSMSVYPLITLMLTRTGERQRGGELAGPALWGEGEVCIYEGRRRLKPS